MRSRPIGTKGEGAGLFLGMRSPHGFPLLDAKIEFRGLMFDVVDQPPVTPAVNLNSIVFGILFLPFETAGNFLFGSGLNFTLNVVSNSLQLGDGDAPHPVLPGESDDSPGEEAVEVRPQFRFARSVVGTQFLSLVASVGEAMFLEAVAGLSSLMATPRTRWGRPLYGGWRGRSKERSILCWEACDRFTNWAHSFRAVSISCPRPTIVRRRKPVVNFQMSRNRSIR